MNTLTHAEQPGSITVAEESTAWPSVSRPTYLGGLGFTYKWNMGWMNDTLVYMSKDPIYRRYDHWHLTFSLIYAFTENFILPYSHDEVVHLKGSMLRKMPGDDWQKFANLRALYGYMYGHPGKKLLFMGSDFAQWEEWNALGSLDWHLLEYPPHQGVQRWVRDLNRFYRSHPALYEQDYAPEGFEWLDCTDGNNVVLSFVRRACSEAPDVLVVCNFTPVPRDPYRIGAPRSGVGRVALDSDATQYGGSGYPSRNMYATQPIPQHGRPDSLNLALPPLSTLVLVHDPSGSGEP
jgi:1,4-alpha-glucan branching enzyme